MKINIGYSDKCKIGFIIGAILTGILSLKLLYMNSEDVVFNTFAIAGFYVVSVLCGIVGGFAAMSLVSKGEYPFRKPNTKFYSVMSFLIAFVAMAVVYIKLGVYPFGEESVLVIDMYHQYVVFFIDLKEKLMSGESLLYSLRLGLGGNYIPLFAYYLASPFNIIAMLFPKESMSEAVALVELLKIGTAAFTFSLFIKNVFKRNDFSVTVISVMYALSSYMMAYSWNIMWLDCLVFLPVAAMGMHSLIYKGKIGAYGFGLAMCLLANFYIGFMVCICLSLYFLSVVLGESGLTFKKFFLRFGRFVLGSLVGGGISAALIIPTYKALQLTSSANDVFPDKLETNFSILELLSQHLYGLPADIEFGDLPNVYVGVIAVLLIVLYILSDIPLRKKVSELSFFFVMFFSLIFNYTDWIWHGLHYPNGLPYRFAFVYIFAALILCYRALMQINRMSVAKIGTALGICITLIIILETKDFLDDKVKIIYGSLLFIFIYSSILFLTAKKKIKIRVCYALLLLSLMFELTFNSTNTIKNIDERFYYSDRDSFYENYPLLTEAVSRIEYEEGDKSLSRMDHLPSVTCNENALYGYKGLTVFSSSYPQRIIKLLGKMGYANNGVNSHMYRCFSPVADSFLGLEYLVTTSNIANHPQLEKVDTIEDSNASVSTYKNRYALQVGAALNPNIKNWDWDNENPFAVLNDLCYLTTGVSDVYDIISLDVESQSNLTAEMHSGDYLSADLETDNINGFATLSGNMPYKGQAYAYANTTFLRSAEVTYGDDYSSMAMSETEPYVVDLGVLEEGERLAVTIEVNYMTSGTVTCAVLNQERFAQAMEIMNKNAFVPTLVEDTHIQGKITADDISTVVFTIPYDDGWEIYVDGKPAVVSMLGGALISFDVAAGEHSIEMKYTPPGFKVGITLSVISLLVYVAWINKERLKVIFEKFKAKKISLKSEKE